MSPEYWQQIEELFQHALDLPPSERAKYLAEKCLGDPELRSEVEKLLTQFEDASSFIETPAYEKNQAGVLSSLMHMDEVDAMLGSLVGSYKIEREIGRGGMGAVYEAIRADGEFRRTVAIKVVKRGMDTDFILRRFRNERQILATLEHPYITRLLDGGTTDDGRPYFVMDYIEGFQLYHYCDKHRLTINQRLHLFTKICEAVEYAHQNLVIHRDLKPSNILVTNDGTPRLLDFGIAKLLNPEMVPETLHPTATHLRMMTVDYASPEQVQGEAITFATDTYSLGVILFELLTGHRPYRFQNRTPHEIARAICHDQPSLPSDAIRRSDYSLPIVQVDRDALTIAHLAELRRESPDDLREKLTGNLDNITLKALSKLPTDRYGSIKKFRDDIEKHLNGKPISAPRALPKQPVATFERSPTARLIAVLPLKLLNFSTSENTDENFLSIGLADAIITRLTSIRAFTVRPTSSISGYNKSDTDPLQAGRELSVDFVLDGRLKKSGNKYRVSLQLLDVQKSATVWAGQFDETFTDVLDLEDHISEQVADALVRQVTGEYVVKLGKRGTDHPKAYEAYLKGRFYWNQFTPDSLPKAIECFHKAVELDPNYALAHVGVADFYVWADIYGLIPSRDSYQHAEAAINRALEIDDTVGEAWATFGLIQNNNFNWAEGKRMHEKAIELNPNYPNAHEWYSSNLVGSGNFAEGLQEIERAEELDPLSLRTKTLVAWTKYQAQQCKEALIKAEEIIDLDPNFPQGHLQRGYVLMELGRSAEALSEIEKGMALMPESALAQYYYCFALASAHRLPEARKVLAAMKNSHTYVKPMFLGLASVAVGDIDEAFVYFNQAADVFDPWLVWLGTDLKLEPIRHDKRYLALMRRTKNPMLKQFEEKARATEKDSIAILPFQLIGEAKTANSYLSLGLADAIILRLASVERLAVRPTSSVLSFENSTSPFEAGHQLNVKYVLAGAIRLTEGKFIVSAQLLDINSSSTIWAQQFDEQTNDVFELEDIIAKKVALALIPQLDRKDKLRLEKKYTLVAEAHNAYVRGRYFWNKLSPDTLFKSLEMYHQAIALDPNYALAYVGIADFHIWFSAIGFSRPDESMRLAKAAAEKALALDPELIEANFALASYEFAHEHNPAKGIEMLRQIIAAKPDYWVAYEALSFLYISQLNFEQGIEMAQKAESLNPLSTRSILSTSWCYYLTGNFAESAAKAREALELDPHQMQGNLNLANALIHLGQPDESISLLEHCLQFSPNWTRALRTLAIAFVAANKREKAEEILVNLEKSSAVEYVSPVGIAAVCAALQQIDKALAWLEKGYDERDIWLIWLESEVDFAPLRDDPRFVDLVKRVKNVEKAAPLVEQNVQPLLSADDPKSVKNVSRELLRSSAIKSGPTGVALAILPLQFIGEAQTVDAYLSVGLADAMITRLSQIRRIIVRPTNSVLRFTKCEDSFAAGRELGVDYVLSGTIRAAGKRIRISAQLLDVQAATTLWSEKFDEEFIDVLELEDQVAEKVAKHLIPQLTAEEELHLAKRNVKNVAAYDAYLRGRYHLNLFTPDNYKQAFAYFQEAIRLEADYALAYASLAEYYFALGTFGNVSPRECYQSAQEMARHAIRLDNTLGEAYSILGFTQLSEFELQTADETFRRAISLNPNYPMAHVFYAVLLIVLGETDRAISEARRAMELNPKAPFEKSHYVWILYQAGRLTEAAALTKQVSEEFPEFSHNIGVSGWVLRSIGELENSLAYAKRAIELSPNTTWLIGNLAATYARLGDREKARELLREIENSPATADSSAYSQAIAYAALGDKETAFAKLEIAYETRDAWIIWLASDAEAAPLRDDPRYLQLMQKTNLSLMPDATIPQS